MPMIDPQFCAQGYCEIFKNHPKKFLIIISQSCPHKTLPEQIFHIQQPNSSMLWFGMFQRKIHQVLLKGCHALSNNRWKKFDFPKVVHKADCPSKYYTFGHQIQVCCALVCSNERSTASCSKSIMNSSKIAQRKFDFPKVVHIQYCPSKYFTCSHLSRVCCALICSNKRSIASCSRSVMNSSKIAQRKFDFPKVVHIHYCPSKYFTCSHLSQVCCALICSNERSIASCAKAITRYHQIAPKKLSLQPLRGS